MHKLAMFRIMIGAIILILYLVVFLFLGSRKEEVSMLQLLMNWLLLNIS